MELANPAWYALRGPHGVFAQGGPLAVRYPPDMAVFAALPDEPTPEAWQQLRDLVGAGGHAFFPRDKVEAPPGWEMVFSLAAIQMVATAVDDELDHDVDRLRAEDVPDMLALVRRAEPGPFEQRTIELGEYFGIRDDDGALIAMAGERMFPSPYREISAVCTDEPHRGKGLAARLTRHLVARIETRGEIPMLHASAENTNAIRLYEKLGFTVSNTLHVSGYRATP
jgi:ribosomal protein S18 acetylase RimI-like enzyme